jgi:hypothetical protein
VRAPPVRPSHTTHRRAKRGVCVRSGCAPRSRSPG